MNPLLTIARFEYSYNLRQPTFYLFVALVLGQGIWSGYQQEVLFPVASPAAGTYHVLSSFGAVVAFITVLLAGQSLTKDNEFNTTSLLYTLPITSRTHFAGRFSGTYATALTLAAFYPIGALLYSIVYTHAVTTISGEALIDGFIRLVALNCFILVSITLSLTVFFRSVWALMSFFFWPFCTSYWLNPTEQPSSTPTSGFCSIRLALLWFGIPLIA
ncbi:ABC transporter permease [Spirosoma agri]|uniref:ABC transporter permease n=1 Tax=Spirosoma agri TaxID=1987381 RepID=UPI001FED06E8|nr:hypothetical protein [Spirosoma agri]